MTGIVGDWMLPEFALEFAEKYPDLWKDGVKKPDDAMYETKLGTLIKIFSFILKGTVSDAIKCFKILTRIKEPYEILDKTSPSGKYLYDKFEKINRSYEAVLEDAKKSRHGRKIRSLRLQRFSRLLRGWLLMSFSISIQTR